MTSWQILLAVWMIGEVLMLGLMWWPRWPAHWVDRCLDAVFALGWPLFLMALIIIVVRNPRDLMLAVRILQGREP